MGAFDTLSSQPLGGLELMDATHDEVSPFPSKYCRLAAPMDGSRREPHADATTVIMMTLAARVGMSDSAIDLLLSCGDDGLFTPRLIS